MRSASAIADISSLLGRVATFSVRQISFFRSSNTRRAIFRGFTVVANFSLSELLAFCHDRTDRRFIHAETLRIYLCATRGRAVEQSERRRRRRRGTVVE